MNIVKSVTLYRESVARLKIDPAFARELGDHYLKTGLWDVNGALTADKIKGTIDFLTNAKALPAGLTGGGRRSRHGSIHSIQWD